MTADQAKKLIVIWASEYCRAEFGFSPQESDKISKQIDEINQIIGRYSD